jgi:hypothetical protein
MIIGISEMFTLVAHTVGVGFVLYAATHKPPPYTGPVVASIFSGYRNGRPPASP